MSTNQSKARSIFLSLLKSELWQIPLTLTISHEEFLDICELAEQQALLGIIATSLIKNNVRLEKMDALRMLAVQDSLILSNKNINSELKLLCDLLEEKGIGSIIVKGQTIAALYPHPFMRSPGDIDIYCDRDNLRQLMSAMYCSWEIQPEGRPTEQHYELIHNGIILELHHCLMHFASGKSQKVWNRLLSGCKPVRVMVDGCSVPTLPPTLNILYTFLHLYHHLIELGVGLRQFCDVAMLLKSHHGHIDVKLLYHWLDELDFRRAFDAVQLVLVEVLGMDRRYVLSSLPCGHPAEDAVNDFMRIVWFGGNFGFHGHNRNFKFRMQYFFITALRKLQLYRRFYYYSPREILASVFCSIPHKALLAVRGEL
ncbi:MAG: nucleotidyltransferase family protein [Prevotella sp.]|nr:nucleotidyltransferase family protein [Prevotella sp.]